jgi:hypothetical protein
MQERRRRELERGVESSGLPPELSRLVLQTVLRARLWRRERQDVAEELAAHFLDGLSAGRRPGELASEFGDPESAAVLITRARRRMRPLVWRAWIAMVRAGALSVILALVVYAVSVFRLYSAAPTVDRFARPQAETSASRESGDVGLPGRTPLSWYVVWPVEAEAVAAETARARRLLNDARRAAARGDLEAGFENLRAACAVIGGLRAGATFPGELRAVSLRAQVVESLEAMARDRSSSPGKGGGLEKGRLLARLRAEEPGPRADVIRTAFRDLLDRIYAPDGRLTGRGLRLLQAMAGKVDPGVVATALEPAYFSFPADRGEVWRELERLLALLGSDDGDPSAREVAELRSEVARLRNSPLSSLRLIPIVIVMPSVLDAATQAILTEERLERLAAAG